jgi:hypothetical protein
LNVNAEVGTKFPRKDHHMSNTGNEPMGKEEPTDNPLEFIGTEDLIKEIKRRHTGYLLVLVTDLDRVHERNECYWWGGNLRCLGMAEYARVRIHADMFKARAKHENDSPEEKPES